MKSPKYVKFVSIDSNKYLRVSLNLERFLIASGI